MKGVMRVILAIAEKYNPRSVRPVPKTGAPPQLVSGGGYSQDHPQYISPQTIHPTDIHPSPRATSPLTSTFMTGAGGGITGGINTLPQQVDRLSSLSLILFSSLNYWLHSALSNYCNLYGRVVWYMLCVCVWLDCV